MQIKKCLEFTKDIVYSLTKCLISYPNLKNLTKQIVWMDLFDCQAWILYAF